MSKHIKYLIFVFVTLTLFSCRNKEILSFGGKMEKFTSSDADGSKTYLGHAEQWIYWEEGDEIMAYVDNDNTKCTLVSGSGSLDAFFKSETALRDDLPTYAIYPHSAGGTNYNNLNFPATQPYREVGTPTGQDSSFGRGALPMVAFKSASSDSAIYFHAVAGILRLQFYSRDLKTVSSILFEEVSDIPKQISGPFTVHDIDQNMPYLTATAAATQANRKILISNINQSIGPNNLLTFYLPLPAVDGPSTTTPYKLKMTITTSDNKYCTKTLGADIHRRNITMMRALEIEDWTNSANDDPQVSIQLVGSGTKDRPFQIYSGKELNLVRQAFKTAATNGTDVIINGQTVTNVPASGETDGATHFKIVRSDIVLLNETDYNNLPQAERDNPSSRYTRWDEGIPNFHGYMYFASSTATNGGITNESNAPLFESIAENAVVYRVYVKGTNTPTIISGGTYSPMCNINNGKMIECHNKCAVTVANNVGLAGLCVTNNGTIQGGANEAQLTTAGNVAGICYTNATNGYIQGSFTLSVAVPQGVNIAGICYTNNGLVEDCQVSANTPITSSGNWGVICYHNNSTINNCISTGALVYTISGSVGGICNINDGVVSNCSNRVEIRASQGNVGGIVAYMNNASAEVFNCCTTAPFIYGVVGTDIATNCGGIVGEILKGKIYNCYNSSYVTGASNSGGMIGHLANDNDIDVQNCWSAQGQLFTGLHDENADEGVFCFSATIAAEHCNRIANATIEVGGHTYSPYQIITMHNDQTLGGTVTPANFIGQHCGVALNAWVNWRHNTGDTRDYYTWTTTANQKPVFVTGMPGKGRKKK